ncbi:uncharacterized protein LOC144885299 [Branchiostoma floridae x Branchiostoma japonicum]
MMDLCGDFTGPHIAALRCSGAGVKRPWPLPLSPMAAEALCRRQHRPLVVAIGCQLLAEHTSVARYTKSGAFLHLLERGQHIFIHVLPDDGDGKEFRTRHNIRMAELPALVVSGDIGTVVVTTARNGRMQVNQAEKSEEDVHAAIEGVQESG